MSKRELRLEGEVLGVATDAVEMFRDDEMSKDDFIALVNEADPDIRSITAQDLHRTGNARLRIGAVSMRGWREAMEDTHRIELRLGDKFADTAFVALYDGHGGKAVSRGLADGTHGLHARLAALDDLSDEQIQGAVVGYDQDLRGLVDADASGRTPGSTCTFAFMMLWPVWLWLIRCMAYMAMVGLYSYGPV